MGHLVRNEPWGIVDIDLGQGAVFVRQDWRYQWRAAPGQQSWTQDETTAYHNAVDQLIWAAWSLRARLVPRRVDHTPSFTPAADLAARFGGRGLQLSFDVRRSVSADAHWNATVIKVDRNKHPLPRSQVWFQQRRLELHSIDVVPLHASRYEGDPMRRPNFRVAPHEFGHTLGHGDERNGTNRHHRDVASIMNIGRQVRPRHLALVVDTLARMVPGCKFVAVMQ
jgi:hypothetical protein